MGPHGCPDARAAFVVSVLNRHLASATDLRSRIKHMCWKARYTEPADIEEVYRKISIEADRWIEMIAVRAIELGGSVNGTIDWSYFVSALPRPYGRDRAMMTGYVDDLGKSIDWFVRALRIAQNEVEALGDAATSDVIMSIITSAEAATRHIAEAISSRS